jgi:hypothetical protein
MFLGEMTGPAEAAKNGVEIAKRHIFDQMQFFGQLLLRHHGPAGFENWAQRSRRGGGGNAV